MLKQHLADLVKILLDGDAEGRVALGGLEVGVGPSLQQQLYSPAVPIQAGKDETGVAVHILNKCIGVFLPTIIKP